MSPRWRRRIKKTLIGLAVGIPATILVLWIVVHTYPPAGPWFADGLRAIIGTEAVSRLEEFAYRTEDTWNQWWRKDEPPKTYWDVPEEDEEEETPPPPPSDGGAPVIMPSRPAKVGPAFESLAAKGDGVWVSVHDVSGGAPAMWKTLIHPDPKRPWAELFVVAFDVRFTELFLVEGTSEPKPETAEGRASERTGLIPSEQQGALVAAFNGGFKAEHGHWGLRTDGVTFLPLRKLGCTVVKQADGNIAIDGYDGEADAYADALFWRQTPPCMFRHGKRHGGLWDPDSRNWGAALGGDTVIRRSAIGLNEARTVLYVGLSNHTAAVAMADGMNHVGAVDVAQLDINWSFPRFVIYKREGDALVAESLFPGFEVDAGEYVREASPRDYFYVTRREPKP